MHKARQKARSPAELDLKQNEGRLFYLDGKSPRSNNSSSTEEGGTQHSQGGHFIEDEGGASSSSFDNSSTGSACSSDLQRTPTRKNFTRTNHSEIEKRRRRKINQLIDELSQLVPICSTASRKPDKISVLRMAVQYVRILGHRDEQRNVQNERFKPSFVNTEEMASLLEDAARGFLFVASSDRFQILYVSETVQDFLPLCPTELIGKRLIDIVHPNDVAVLREQLTPAQTSRTSTSPRFVYNPTASAPSSSRTFVTSCRRAFFFRLKNHCHEDHDMTDHGAPTASTDEAFRAEAIDVKDYTIIHCIGFLKSWQPGDTPVFAMDSDLDVPASSCFFAIGRKVDVLAEEPDSNTDQHLSDKPLEFTCRCAADGRYLYVDPKMVRIFGYLPQDLLSQNCYNFIAAQNRETIRALTDVLLSKKTSEVVITDEYQMVARNGTTIPVLTALFCFYNPVTNELEYVVQQSTVISRFGSQNESQYTDDTAKEPSFEVYSSREVLHSDLPKLDPGNT